ncbi:MAG TPA: 7-cyano-7-deazaguanine synthase [Methanocorpusculum sp.]|nr:7-cyano-7-deazaguanine synthase [Methanocorpusculum sp.]
MKPEFGTVSSALVALSGGVDSAVLLHCAKEAGLHVEAAIVVSEFLPSGELQTAKSVAEREHVVLHVLPNAFLNNADIRRNPENRCYLCKKEISGLLKECARERGLDAVLEGTNYSDGIRPGRRALEEEGIFSPLSAVSKEEIIAYAREHDIPVHPPSACLATRVPVGTPLSKDHLALIDSAENCLRNAGISGILRVRLSADRHAAIEVEAFELATAELCAEKCKSLGITIDSISEYGRK